MAGGADGDGKFPSTLPPTNGGELLLALLQRPSTRQSQTALHLNPQPQTHSFDPAVAAIGPSLTSLPPSWPSNIPDFLYPVPLSPWSHQPLSTPVSHNSVSFPHLQNSFPPPPPSQFSGTHCVASQSSDSQVPGMLGCIDDLKKLGFNVNHDRPNYANQNFSQPNQLENKLQFGSLNPSLISRVLVNGNSSVTNSQREVNFRETVPNGFNRNQLLDTRVNSSFNSPGNFNSDSNLHSFRPGDYDSRQDRGGGLGENYEGGSLHQKRASDGRQQLSGRPSHSKVEEHWDSRNNRRRDIERGANKEQVRFGELGFIDDRGNRFSVQDGKVCAEGSHAFELSATHDHSGRSLRTNTQSVAVLNSEETLHGEVAEGRARDRHQGRGWVRKEADLVNGNDNLELDNLGEQLVDSLLHEDEPDEKSEQKHIRREKDCRGSQLLTQRMRLYKRQMRCRGNIDMLTTPFLAIYESLIPPKEEKEKQKQLLNSLENLVVKEWPSARLCLFGSCANSFGVSNSDVDVCLVLGNADIDKSEIILKLADILQTANLQNVQALTRARVPIVKLKDQLTGISCDICVNNVLAVVNTKLLRDYAQIDVRLHQLAFIVKHWAKSRGVNETYQGTLSSYAYVLMCIHYLQLRRPAILPCLQEMKITFHETVDNIECAYFDQVEKLQSFGSHNNESIAQLVWGFFNYWAYCHDYAGSVISVRTGSIISKRSKDWTRRIGNDRHLICIEDPFETSHDLGRVVDKFSIKVLREEFERAAEILQYDQNPCQKLFEPFVPS